MVTVPEGGFPPHPTRFCHVQRGSWWLKLRFRDVETEFLTWFPEIIFLQLPRIHWFITKTAPKILDIVPFPDMDSRRKRLGDAGLRLRRLWLWHDVFPGPLGCQPTVVLFRVACGSPQKDRKSDEFAIVCEFLMLVLLKCDQVIPSVWLHCSKWSVLS